MCLRIHFALLAYKLVRCAKQLSDTALFLRIHHEAYSVTVTCPQREYQNSRIFFLLIALCVNAMLRYR